MQLTQIGYESSQFSNVCLREDITHVRPFFVRISLIANLLVAFSIHFPSCFYELLKAFEI